MDGWMRWLDSRKEEKRREMGTGTIEIGLDSQSSSSNGPIKSGIDILMHSSE